MDWVNVWQRLYATQKNSSKIVFTVSSQMGGEWEFLLLENAILSIHTNNYYINTVADIVDRIGYIAKKFITL